MGRLLQALLASSSGTEPCESRESANAPRPPAPYFADSQDSQAVKPEPPSATRGFAEIALSKHQASRTRLKDLCAAHKIDWSLVLLSIDRGDVDAAILQLDADNGDFREVAAVVGWLRLVADKARSAR